MSAFWVKFTSGFPACVEAPNKEEARKLAAELSKREVKEIFILPYPSDPRLNEETFQWEGKDITTPSFCYKPEQCKGHTSCPQRHSCTE